MMKDRLNNFLKNFKFEDHWFNINSIVDWWLILGIWIVIRIDKYSIYVEKIRIIVKILEFRFMEIYIIIVGFWGS